MEVIQCDYKSEEAHQAYRLRYEVYAKEYGVQDPYINHREQIYTDPTDEFARIYLALKDGKPIATVRSISSKNCDLSKLVSPHIYKALGLEKFLEGYPESLAISERFAISSDSRGSIAASRVTQKMYEDYLKDNTTFVFSWCAPWLFDFYMQLGFHIYSESVCDKNGLWTPIVLPILDIKHLKSIKSSLYKQLSAVMTTEQADPSVKWFYNNYSDSIDRFVSKKDTLALAIVHEITCKERIDGNINILEGLTESDVTDLINSVILMNISSGQEVMKNGQINDEMFLILDGEIVYSLDESSAPIQYLTKGRVFGEVSMLTRAPRYGYLFASVDAKLAIISRQALSRIMKTNSDLALKLLFNLSRSLALKLQTSHI